MTDTASTPELDCPTCGSRVRWSSDYPYRPFCSKRCQQIDFGDWADEKKAIPGEPVLDPDLDPDQYL